MRNTLISSLIFIIMCGSAFGQEIDIQAIIEIESGGDPNALSSAHCRGLMQISEIVYKEFINYVCSDEFNREKFNGEDITIEIALGLANLYDPKLNVRIGTWYLGRIKTHYLKDKGTLEDVLICWHDGYGNWKKWKEGKRKLGKEMLNFIRKYNKLTKTVGKQSL